MIRRYNHRGLIHSSGFSLIELMVAITIGMILTIAIGSIFVQSKKTYAVQERLSRIQENGRFAMHFLMKDLRMAGYAGCVDDLILNQTISNHLKKKDDFTFKAHIPIEGLDHAKTDWYPSTSSDLPPRRDSTDAVMIRMVDPGIAVTVSGAMPSPSREIKVNGTDGINQGDIVMLSDCANADVFEVTHVQTSDHIQHGTGAGSGNESGELSKSYTTGAKIYKYIGRRYYIGESNGMPTLFRDTNAGTPEPLVEGIENMQIRYGKDTNSDGYPDVYLAAGAAGLTSETDWKGVVSVRIGILARSAEPGPDVNEQIYDVNGEPITPELGDRFQRRTYMTTVLLRNLAK
jgi:type IV pilus assembly protein PilW